MRRARSQAFDKEGLRCGALQKVVECGAFSGARTDVSIEPLASKYCLSAWNDVGALVAFGALVGVGCAGRGTE
jgi:hypothetical protein